MNTYSSFQDSGHWPEIDLLAETDIAIIVSLITELGKDISDLAVFIDRTKYPGILKELACLFVKQVEPLLKEALAMDSVESEILKHPREFAQTDDDQEARDAIVNHFIGIVKNDSAPHVKRSMVAHIELLIF